MSTLVAGRPVVTTVLSSWPKTVRRWLERANVETLFIAKASPWENGYIELFNGKLRDELLNRELFLSLEEARWVLDRWRLEYNHVRLHSAIGYVAPADKLNGLEAVIFAEWDRKLDEARERRRQARQAARMVA